MQNFARLDKNEENLEKYQENFEIFWSKSLWKMDFFSQFYYIFFGFPTILRTYIHLKDKTRFLQQVFLSRGNLPALPPSRRYWQLEGAKRGHESNNARDRRAYAGRLVGWLFSDATEWWDNPSIVDYALRMEPGPEMGRICKFHIRNQ